MASELTVNTDKLMIAYEEQGKALRVMAETVRIMSEKLDTLTREVRRLEKLTPMQARELNLLIRKRVTEIEEQYHMDGCERAINKWLRDAVKDEFGTAVKDVPRVDFDTCKQVIKLWDDTRKIYAYKARKEED